MRLIIVIYSLDPGGAQRVATVLANAWAERGNDVTVLTFSEVAPFYPLNPHVVHRPVGSTDYSSGILQKLVNNIRRLKRLRAELQLSRAACVVSFIDQVNVVTSLAALGLGSRVVISERVDPAMAPITPLWRRLRDWSYLLADCIVVQTSSAKEALPKWAQSRAVIIPNPVRAWGPYPALSECGERRTILAIGRLVHQKGFDLLIRAFAQLKDRFPSWDVRILGEGAERVPLESLAKQYGLIERVHFIGVVQDVTEHLRLADLFVLPSRFEGFPNALCEAMSCGLAVVAADCRSGPREIVRNGEDGVLVPPNDVQALASAMERLMQDEGERRRLGSRAIDIGTRYSLRTVLDAWESAVAPRKQRKPVRHGDTGPALR